MKTSAETPIAVPNDSTVVTISSTGATIARSSIIRISMITTRITGMIRARSWRDASFVSIAVAVTPPTTAPVPSSDVRRRRTVSSADVESAAAVSVPCSITSPSTTVGSGAGVPGRPTGWTPSFVTGADPLCESFAVTVTPSMPLSASSASAAFCRESFATTTWTGLPDPPGKCSPSTFCPSRACEEPSTRSDCGTPEASSCSTPTVPRASTRVVAIQITRERRRISSARRAHTPLEGMPPSAATISGAYTGRRGQNAARPKAMRRAGSRVSADSIANAIPIAATGPSALFDFRSLSSRQRSPAITVPPEARIGSNEPFHAASTAFARSFSTRSASRKRETKSSA